MRTGTLWLASGAGLLAGLLLGWSLAAGPVATAEPAATELVSLPTFTEEREAAALHFVKKHLPELLPLLQQLKKNNAAQYQQEIREIFQVTELLAELRNEPKRHELELKIWKTENKAHALVAKLSTPSDEERKKLQDQIQELAKELVELDIAVLELKTEQLKNELGEAENELAKARDTMEKQSKARYEGLIDKARKPKK